MLLPPYQGQRILSKAAAAAQASGLKGSSLALNARFANVLGGALSGNSYRVDFAELIMAWVLIAAKRLCSHYCQVSTG